MLRPDSPIERCKFAGDEEDQTFHLGAFMDNKLVSVASFYFEKHPDLEEPFQFRLRGMATLPDYQHKGLSTELLKMAFPIIKQNFCHLVWCNARVTAVEFYQKVGFEKVGEQFDIPGIGPHLLMFKSLN
jgi:predicted GNAT family N-acyltransferase